MTGHNEDGLLRSAEDRLGSVRTFVAAAVFACEGLDQRQGHLLSSILRQAVEGIDEVSDLLEELVHPMPGNANLAEGLLTRGPNAAIAG